MKFKSEIAEVLEYQRSRHSGYKMKTSPSGRRYRVNEYRTIPTGMWAGEVFQEIAEEKTGDWGDGIETKRWLRRDVVVRVEQEADRDLIERRTAAVLKALNELE